MKTQLEQLVKAIILEEFGAEHADVPFSVTYPPKPEMGDYSTNAALVLGKRVGKSPQEIAARIAAAIPNSQFPISKVEVLGGFVNVTVDAGAWFAQVLQDIAKQGAAYGTSQITPPEKIMVEYLSPNTNKPLHLGHLRNGVTGVATINMLAAQGHDITRVGIINDRGVHICKAMLAYQRWGAGATPETAGVKPDHFVGNWYVRFSKEAEVDPSLNDQAQAMLLQWEAGDPAVRELWQMMRQWVLAGWKQTEEVLGFSYDKAYFESDVYQQGKEIVQQGFASGVFRKIDKGNIVFDLSPEEFGLDEAGQPRMITLLRADGTSLYTTQDVGLAVQRAQEFHLDRLIYVVGSEQKFHFQSLFAILRALGFAWAQKLHHLWYGMVYLPDGKMKSREGTVVDADDLVKQMIELAITGIIDRSNRTNGTYATDEAGVDTQAEIAQEEVQRRAGIIALGAIKFYLLKQKPTVDIHFNPKESLSFEGFTGPYCQYAYARARSILRQVGGQSSASPADYAVLGGIAEKQLLQKLESFPEVVAKAAEDYNPSAIATHVFETAQAFSSFYSAHSVLKAENEAVQRARVQLVAATAQVVQNGLALLGIDVLEEM